MSHHTMPAWLYAAVIGGTIWTAVAVMRGVTFALTHAFHVM